MEALRIPAPVIAVITHLLRPPYLFLRVKGMFVTYDTIVRQGHDRGIYNHRCHR